MTTGPEGSKGSPVTNLLDIFSIDQFKEATNTSQTGSFDIMYQSAEAQPDACVAWSMGGKSDGVSMWL